MRRAAFSSPTKPSSDMSGLYSSLDILESLGGMVVRKELEASLRKLLHDVNVVGLGITGLGLSSLIAIHRPYELGAKKPALSDVKSQTWTLCWH